MTLLLVMGMTALASPSAAAVPHRAFSASSYWNQPLPADAPKDTNSAKILEFLKNDNTTNYIRFAGTKVNAHWADPIYWSTTSDPTYPVRNTCSDKQPPEFQSVRIPLGARPDDTSDATMTVYDVEKGLVYGFWRASFASNEWSACGGTVYYLNSNGLDGVLPQSDEPRNFGHRGVPPPTYAVRYDEVSAGAIDHVLKIAVNNTADEYVFPMTGHENGSTDPYAPPEGTRIRIKPSVDLSRLGLKPAALVVATALQKYGAVIGDQSGGPLALKVENTVVEGRGQLWTGVLSYESLSRITLDMYEVIQLGYGSGPAPPPPPPPPNAPSGLTAAAVSSSQINLSWTDNSTTEDGFRIERSPNVTPRSFAEIAFVPAGTTTYGNTGLGTTTTYHYRVRAYNSGGSSSYSSEASATTTAQPPPPPPAPPSNLVATAASSSQINLSWTDNSTTEDGFRIERSPNVTPRSFAEIATVPAGTTTYGNTGLGATTTYHYRVRAYNAGGSSSYSSEASATTSAPPSPPPPGVVLFLHNQPTPPTDHTTARKNMPMNTATPTATTLFRYSTDHYTGEPGRHVEKLSTNHTQPEAKYMANWVYQLATTTPLSGNAELKIWVAVKDLKCDKTPAFTVYLREKTSATNDTGTLLAAATVVSPPPGSSEPCNFRFVTATLPVNRTITAGNWLELKVTVDESTGDAMLFAYDTTTFDSRLKLP